jgi:ArsR family transcriptional regulator
MNKAEKFDASLQELARFAKVISHPARLAILKYLAETKYYRFSTSERTQG